MKPSQNFSPPPFHKTLSTPHPRQPAGLYSPCVLLLFFPDCNASVHKGCRDSLPVCAKVKMKVNVPSHLLHHRLYSVLLSCRQCWFELIIYAFMLLCFFSGQLPKQQFAVPDSSSSLYSHHEEQMWVSMQSRIVYAVIMFCNHSQSNCNFWTVI